MTERISGNVTVGAALHHIVNLEHAQRRTLGQSWWQVRLHGAQTSVTNSVRFALNYITLAVRLDGSCSPRQVVGSTLTTPTLTLVGTGAFFVGAVSMGALTATTGTFSGHVGIGGSPTATSPLNITGLPTSAVGLNTGDIYSPRWHLTRCNSMETSKWPSPTEPIPTRRAQMAQVWYSLAGVKNPSPASAHEWQIASPARWLKYDAYKNGHHIAPGRKPIRQVCECRSPAHAATLTAVARE